MNSITGTIFDIGEASIHDGPGLRITIFMKGCPLRYRWCHSPEGQSGQPQWMTFPGGKRLAGEEWTVPALADYLLDKTIFLDGVTFSGGEPLAQSEFLLEVLRRLQGKLPAIIDTCGFCREDDLLAVAPLVEKIHWGLKLLDDAQARLWTGQGSALILRNLLRLDAANVAKYRFRIPLVPGVIDTRDNLNALLTLCSKLHNLEAIDFLPYNQNAGAKYAACGLSYSPGFNEKATTNLDIDAFQAICPVPATILE